MAHEAAARFAALQPERAWRAAAARLLRMPSAVVFSLAVAFVALITVVDILTGPELAFSIFYLLPIALVAWHGHGRGALVLAIVSAACWFVADLVTHPAYTSPLVPCWNGGVRLGIFVSFAKLLTTARHSAGLQHELARVDITTGLPNLRALRELAERELAIACRHQRPISLAYLDLDGFKRVNDEQGHAAGDALLRLFASQLVSSVRRSDIVARIGGDEFAVLLPETDADAALRVAERIHAGVTNSEGVTVSVGLATAHKPLPTSELLLSHADSLMYEAKQGGKDRTVLGVVGGVGDTAVRPA